MCVCMYICVYECSVCVCRIIPIINDILFPCIRLKAWIPSKAARKDFCRGGFYRFDVSRILSVLVINTVLWSAQLRASNAARSEHCTDSPCDSRPADPWRQFEWIERELAATQRDGRQVYVFGHGKTEG